MTLRHFIAILLFSAAPLSAQAETPTHSHCPVQPEEEVVTKFKTEWHGKTIYFCCPDCVESFNANPESYAENLPESLRPAIRGKWLVAFDRIWNSAAKFPALSIGVLAILVLLVLRWKLGGVPFVRTVTSRKAFALVAATVVAGECISAHRYRVHTERALAELELERRLHFATFHDYGYPPVPSPTKGSPRVKAVFYRGNDERNGALFNDGFYRTATFSIELCDHRGNGVDYGDSIQVGQLFLRVRIDRAPGTADYFWMPDRMANMFATRESGKFMGGRERLPADSTSLTEMESMQRWEFKYPVHVFADSESEGAYRGIVYLCEKRFDDADQCVGSRFHYGIQLDLNVASGAVQPSSRIWMGALYRSSVIPVWQIPDSEWLSEEPIPEIDGPNSADPALLGISGASE